MYRFYFMLLLLWGASLPLKAATDSVDKVKVPPGISKDYKKITHYLCDTISSGNSKAHAIYNWITTNVAYDVYGLDPGAVNSKDPNTIIQNGSAVCAGYSTLFTAMCNEAGIRTINIEGYTKDWIFDKGDKLYMPRHMWSALLIDGQWLMADVTWGAGFVATDTNWWRKLKHRIYGAPVRKTTMRFIWQYEPKWLLQDPLEFRYTHLPAFPPFQFSDTAMPLSVFEAGDSAIRAFNTVSHPIANSDELMRLSGMDDTDIQLQYAATIYEFNHRYALAAAIDHNMHAIQAIKAINLNGTMAEYKKQVADAYNLMSQSREMVSLQYTLSLGQYSTLKSKNMQKYSDAMEYFRSLNTVARRMTGEIKRYNTISERKLNGLTDMRRDFLWRTEKIDTCLPPDDPELDMNKHVYDSLYAVITDSINERRKRLVNILSNEALLSHLQYYINDGNAQLSSLLSSLGTANTLLSGEAYYRLYLQDNLDEDAGKYYNAMKKLKDAGIDSSHRHYLECFDSVVALTYESLQIEKWRLYTYQSVLNDIVKLTGKYNPDSSLRVTYTLWAKEMIACMQRMTATADASAKFFQYLDDNAAIINERQAFIGKTAKWMQRLEKTRKDMENKTIMADQLRDMSDIAKCRESVKKSISILEAAKHE